MRVFSDLTPISEGTVGGILNIYVWPDEDDVAYYTPRKGKLGRTGAAIALQKDGIERGMHPDLFGLLSLLLVGPFTAKRITLDAPVSEAFADAVRQHMKREIGPVDPKIVPRNAPATGRDALAFSGGVDSIAALALLPQDTIPIFMNRTRPRVGKAGIYKADAALLACDDVKRSGYDVRIIDTSMELMRDPVGFAVDWTNSVGAVVHADQLSLRSVSFGMIAESAFATGHERYSELADRAIYRSWAPLFECTGLPIALPTSGLSEVLTTKIAAAKKDIWRAQSCVRGTAEKPCMRCFKCFRKTILDARIGGRDVDPRHFDIVMTSAEVSKKLLALPIHHENVLAYSIQGLKTGAHPIFHALQRKTAPIFEYANRLSFMDRIYPNYLHYLPEHLRPVVAQNLAQYAETMSESDLEVMRKWDIHFLSHSPEYLSANSDLATAAGKA